MGRVLQGPRKLIQSLGGSKRVEVREEQEGGFLKLAPEDGITGNSLGIWKPQSRLYQKPNGYSQPLAIGAGWVVRGQLGTLIFPHMALLYWKELLACRIYFKALLCWRAGGEQRSIPALTKGILGGKTSSRSLGRFFGKLHSQCHQGTSNSRHREDDHYQGKRVSQRYLFIHACPLWARHFTPSSSHCSHHNKPF